VTTMWAWLVLFLLGAYHGLNPAMGWLFAVALGLQEKTGRAVICAMPFQSGVTMQWWFPVGLHTLGYLLTTASLALVVYHKLGIAFLRSAWFNLDLLWVGALLAMGILTAAI